MKKLLCILMSLMLSGYSAYCAGYEYNIIEKSFPVDDGMISYETARGNVLQSNVLIMYKYVFEPQDELYYLYDYHGNYIAGPYKNADYCCQKNGKEYYVTERREYYSPEDTVYKYFQANPDEKNKATGFQETDSGISIVVGFIVDESGKEFFTKEDPVNIYTSWDTSDVFVKKYNSSEYFKFDFETMSVTDEPAYFSRIEKVEDENGVNYYDNLRKEFIFDRCYNSISTVYYKGKHYFRLSDGNKTTVTVADGTAGKIIPVPLSENEFTADPLCLKMVFQYPVFSYIRYKYFLFFECKDKDGNTFYIDTEGKEYTAELYEKLTSSNADDVLMVLGEKLPEGIEIEYSDGYVAGDNNNKFYSKRVLSHGKEIISSHDGYTVYENGYYIAVSDYGKDYFKNLSLYDIEGNLVLKQKDRDSYYHFSGNKVYVYETGNLFDETSKPKIKEYTFLNAPPKIYINGDFVKTDTLPRIRNNITIVPVRAIAEKLGFDVDFIPGSGEIKITKDEKEIQFILGSKTAVINGEEKELAASPEIINDRTLVPLRAVCEAFGLGVLWDDELRTVYLNY